MTEWIYEPGIGVGPFRFGFPLKSFLTEYALHLEREYLIYDDPCKPRKIENWRSDNFDICLSFDESHLLTTLSDSESLVFLGVEIIGMRENRLYNYFGCTKDINRYDINRHESIALYGFDGNILVSTIDGYVSGVTVSSYSVPYFKRKRFRKFGSF
jgi:hypothetical protein